MDPDAIVYMAAVITIVAIIVGYMWHRNTTFAEAVKWTDEFFDYIRGKDDTMDGHIEWLQEQWKDFLKSKKPVNELPDIPDNH